MSMRMMTRLIMVAISLSLLIAGAATAQTSVGFAEPEDTANLLDYRLPTWSYRTWDGYFNLSGGGRDGSYGGTSNIENNIRTRLGSNYYQRWESETLDQSLSGHLSGNYSHSHSGNSDSENSGHNLNGAYTISGSSNRYLKDSLFSVLGSARLEGNYNESVRDIRIDENWVNTSDYTRGSSRVVQAGAGFGRVRNVTPLVRAQRLSERLRALDRQPLSDHAILQVAEVLATQYGYNQVFDRGDRFFWQDVLEPVLAEGRALSPYEVMYLTDVLNEDVGSRQQGWQLSAQYQYMETQQSREMDPLKTFYRSPVAHFIWSNNLSMRHQLSCVGNYRYDNGDNNSNSHEAAELEMQVAHLWNVADRHNLETRINAGLHNGYSSDQRDKSIQLTSNLTTYIENQLSLSAGVNVRYFSGENGYNDWESYGWSWGYQMGIVYHLDRALF